MAVDVHISCNIALFPEAVGEHSFRFSKLPETGQDPLCSLSVWLSLTPWVLTLNPPSFISAPLPPARGLPSGGDRRVRQ